MAGLGFAGGVADGACCATDWAVPITASAIVAPNAATNFLAVRAFADMIRCVIRFPSIPAGVSRPLPVRAPIACLDALKKAGA